MSHKLTLSVVLLFIIRSQQLFAQAPSLNANFAHSTEIVWPTHTRVPKVDTIIIPKQKNYNKDSIKVAINPKGTNIDLRSIEVPINNTFIIDTSKSDTFYFPYTVTIDPGNVHESWLTWQFTAIDTTKDTISLADGAIASKKVYFERYQEDSLSTNKSYEFWMYIGTNLDLVDGIQAQDLYFRADYLAKLGKKRSWMFISLGKSRYFDNSDSIKNANYTTYFHLTNDDSTQKYVSGYFNGLKTIKTDNLFCSLRYMWRTSDSLNKHSKFFVTGGEEIQYLTITSTFSNLQYLSADTTTIPIDTGFTVHPLTTHNYNEWNYNTSLGIMHVLDIDGFDIKTQFVCGLNFYQFAKNYLTQGIFNTQYTFMHESSFYSEFRIDATLLNPGFSFGFEMFNSWRRPNPLDANASSGGDHKLFQPLFNISLTKVFNLNHLKSLFTPVASAN